MASDKNGKKRGKDDESSKSTKEKKPSILSTIKSETKRGIYGVFIFVIAIVLALSALGLAGIFGDKLYHGIYFLLGIGYFLLPFLLVGYSITLFRKRDDTSVRSVRMVGATLSFISLLTIVGVLAGDRAGIVGRFVAEFLVTYLDRLATLVVLAGILIASMLLLFDSELWVALWRKFTSLFKRASKEGESAQALASTEREEIVLRGDDLIEAPARTTDTVAPLAADLADEDVDDDEEEDMQPEARKDEEFDELFTEPKKKEKQAPVFEMPSAYSPPPLSILESDRGKPNVGDTKARANLIRRTLQHFKIPVEMDEIIVGPTVTRYSLKPAEGVKLSRIVQLQQNLELALAASPIRIEAPIPGRSLVGIEVPNTGKAIVGLAGLLAGPEFQNAIAPLVFALGKDIAGSMHYADIAEMPHLLIAGATKSGKSVMVHALITSLLYRNGPERLKLILVDPKQVELTLYDNIPHLLTPVITDPKRAILALKWAAKEMEERYVTLRSNKVRDIHSYHTEVLGPAMEEFQAAQERGEDMSECEPPKPMPHIVIVIDELADIMQAYPRELEAAIVRLAQKSRAVGIHLVLSTQRPSVKVVTGLIKANLPARLALKVSSHVDSQTILDAAGAEKLLGYGDMLYQGPDMPKPRRIQAPYVTAEEVKKVVSYLVKHNEASTDDIAAELASQDDTAQAEGAERAAQDDATDQLINDVLDVVLSEGKASTSLLQRRFKIGYGRAARIMDTLEEMGVFLPSEGHSRPRSLNPDYIRPSSTGASDSLNDTPPGSDHHDDR